MSSGSGWMPSGALPSQAGPSPKLRTSGGGFIDGNGAPRRPRTSGGRSWADALVAAAKTASVIAEIEQAVRSASMWSSSLGFPGLVLVRPIMPSAVVSCPSCHSRGPGGRRLLSPKGNAQEDVMDIQERQVGAVAILDISGK